MTNLGFKALSSGNISQPDSVLALFVAVTPEGAPIPLSVRRLIEEILAPRLVSSVPHEITALFEVARGCICYGSFFYPLFMLGTEQLFRVVEAAVTAKCKAISRTPPKSYAKRIAFLIQKGAIPQSDLLRWTALRELRNIASHPTTQSLMPPSYAIDRLTKCADAVNSLFAGA